MRKTKKTLLLILLISLALSSCKSIPAEPQINYCSLLFSESRQEFYFFCVDNKTNVQKRVPFDEFYKESPICTSTDDYVKIIKFRNKLIEKLKKVKAWPL